MPPETVVDASGDLYCLGRLLFVAVTGAKPAAFPALPEHLDPAQEEAYGRLSKLIDRACAPERAERFQSAREFRAALLATRGLEHLAPRPRRKLGPVHIGAITALILALGFGASRMLDGVEGASAARAPEGSILLRHYERHDPDDPARSGPVRLVDGETRDVPLVAGGLVQVEARVSEPLFLLVACIDDSKVTVLHPDGADQEPLATWRSGHYALEPPEGQLTFVLLADSEPFADPEAVARSLSGSLPRCRPSEILLLGADGSVQPLPATASHRGDLGRRVPDTEAPVDFGFLPALHDRFTDRYELVRAITVPLVVPEAR
jgi:hypothetical protein